MSSDLRSLEARLVEADLVGLLVHDLPLLVAQHYSDYRTVEAKIRSGYATGLHENVDPYVQLFHGLQPHLAVSPDGTVDGTYIRQAVEHIMKVCLPPEDWAAETERSIVCEIVVKVLVGSAIPKLTQPWFAHKILLEVLGPPRSSSSLSAVRAILCLLRVLTIFFSQLSQTLGLEIRSAHITLSSCSFLHSKPSPPSLSLSSPSSSRPFISSNE